MSEYLFSMMKSTMSSPAVRRMEFLNMTKHQNIWEQAG